MRIPAPHGSNYLILLCSGLWILLPDQAAHLSERKRNFNQRDTYCKKKKIETVSKFKNLVNKHTTMRGIFVILNATGVCCPVDSPLYFNALLKKSIDHIKKPQKGDMNLYGHYSFSCDQVEETLLEY